MKKQLPGFALILFIVFTGLSHTAFAGGPWVIHKGKSYLTLGYSVKLGYTRWSPTVNDNGTPDNLDDDIITYSLTRSPDSTTVNGMFHNFQYAYFNFEVGVFKNFEIFGNINYLHGKEAQRSDPVTGQLHTYYDEQGNIVKGSDGAYHYAVWEVNNGFTDSWLGMKYQFLHGAWPMAIEVNSRFPDLYNQPSPDYSRYNYQYIKQTDPATGLPVTDTIVEASSEWRGLLKRDFAGLIHIGHSFLDGKIWTQGFAGYNIRQGAFADQIMAGISGGYNARVSNRLSVVPEIYVDYVGGVGNGGVPNATDRFNWKYANYYFNNSKQLRYYLNASLVYNNVYSLKVGFGDWLWGRGTVNYNEYFAQFGYYF